jgi:chemotaxis-related protein WspB
MLYLLLEVAGQQYAVEATRVVEVLPLVQITVIPRAPTEVAGIFSYRGRPVPLIDLRRLTLRRPARPKFSTRIILVADRGGDGSEQLIGIIAERVTETTRRSPADFKNTGFDNPATPYLAGVATTGDGLVQRLDVERLLPQATRAMLFATPARA